jgi:hypothetical protein
MGLSEKRRVFRARAQGLRRRAMDLVDHFKSPAVRAQLELVVLRIDEELEWLEHEPKELASLKSPHFLPESTLCVMRLADLLRRAGRDAPLPPDLKGRLDEHRSIGRDVR